MTKGIYSIETVWFEKETESGEVEPDQTSIYPMLGMLRDSYRHVRVIHRDVATRKEFKFFIKKWCKYPADYPILHIGVHGVPHGLELYDCSFVALSDIAMWIKSSGISCENSVIHFSSCGSLRGTDTSVFLYDCGFSAVSGYTRTMYPVANAWAFEMIYLALLQKWPKRKLTSDRMKAIKNELADRPYADLTKHLGFELRVD